MRKITCSIVPLILALFLAPTAFAQEMLAESIRPVNPYIVTVPPTATVTTAFMGLSNSGTTLISVTKVVSPVCSKVEIHQTVQENGMMKMVFVRSIDLQPGLTFSFEPGIYHLMLIGLKQPLNDGDVVPLTFSFNDGSTLMVNVPVKDLRKTHDHGHTSMEGMNMDEGSKGN